MNEEFYTPSIPQPRGRSRGSTTYQFRQPQTRINPLALRRLQLQQVTSQRREEIAAGNQELAAMKQMAELEKEEYAIKQQIATTRDVVSAQREVAKLDPESDPHYIQSFADVMSRHSRASKDKFLNDAFTQGAEIFKNTQKADLADANEAFKTKEHITEAEAKAHLKTMGQAIEGGYDPEAHKKEDGTYDFPAMNTFVAKMSADAGKVIDDAMKTMTAHSVTVDSDRKKRVVFDEKKPDKPAITPTEVVGITERTLKLQGQQLTNVTKIEALDQEITNNPKASNIDNLRSQRDSLVAAHKGAEVELKGLQNLITPSQKDDPAPPVTTPPAAASAPPAPTAATPPSAAAPTKPLSPFDAQWNDLTEKMKTAQTNADLHRKDRDAATQKLTELPAFSSPDEFAKHAATSKASGDMVDQFEKVYDDASAQRSALLEKRTASIPDVGKPRPSLGELLPPN